MPRPISLPSYLSEFPSECHSHPGIALLVCGDREWTDRKAILNQILKFYHSPDGIAVIIEGDARGADRLAGHIAREYDIPHLAVPANWARYGRSAGPKRNENMLAQLLFYTYPQVLAFHDNISSSKGTAHMLRISKRAGIPCKLIKHKIGSRA